MTNKAFSLRDKPPHPYKTWLQYCVAAKERSTRNLADLSSGLPINFRARVAMDILSPSVIYRIKMIERFIDWLNSEIRIEREKEIDHASEAE